MWPFTKRCRFPGVKENRNGTIEFTLTDEEALRADCALDNLAELSLHPEAADRIRNGTIAVALSNYANELVTALNDIPESEYRLKWHTIQLTVQKAVAAVWKSYSLYPLPVFLYERAAFMKMLGMQNQAQQLFSQFLFEHSGGLEGSTLHFPLWRADH